MSVTLLSYATKEYRIAQRLLNFSGRLCGVDRCISYSRKDLIRTDFYRQHQHILDQKRGGGYWLWKPYYILQTLRSMQEGEILIYADAGLLFRKKISPLTELVKTGNGIALFYNYGKLSRYTKRDVFVALGCDSEAYHSAPLIHAGIQVYRKCAAAITFLEEVLKFATQDELITDAPNTLGLPNLGDFIDHRHDQSVFSLLAHKNRLTLFTDPSQFRVVQADYQFGQGDIPGRKNPYGHIVYIHRYRNNQIFYLSMDLFRKLFSRKHPKSSR